MNQLDIIRNKAQELNFTQFIYNLYKSTESFIFTELMKNLGEYVYHYSINETKNHKICLNEGKDTELLYNELTLYNEILKSDFFNKMRNFNNHSLYQLSTEFCDLEQNVIFRKIVYQWYKEQKE